MVHATPRLRRVQGFTLLEVLVVLAIIGILMGAASLTIGTRHRADLNDESQRLALLFETAATESQLRARLIAWVPDAQGYHFVVRDDEAWHALTDDVLRPRAWDTTVTRVVIQPGGSALPVPQLIFGQEAIVQPLSITLSDEQKSVRIDRTAQGRYEVH